MKNKILTAANLRLLVTNLFGGDVDPTDTLEGLPLGTVDDSPTGEVALKVKIVEGGGGGGGGADTLFGYGSDGDLAGGAGATTLARDMYYNNVTLGAGDSINCAGYRLFVNGILNIANADSNAIQRNGNAGTATANTAAGGAAAVLTPNTIGGAVASQVGKAGGTTVGTIGGAGAATACNGGKGGDSGAGGNGGVAVAATGTLTAGSGAGVAALNGDTITIGIKTYTMKTALTPTEGEVLINAGGGVDAWLTNLSRAINHTGTPDVDYKCAAANTQVSAGAVAAHAIVVTALVAGAAGNAINVGRTSGVTITWSPSTTFLTGGLDNANLGGAGIAAASPTAFQAYLVPEIHNLRGNVVLSGGGSGSSGGSGAGDATAGGGSGSSGTGGGIVMILARTINRGASAGAGVIRANGGAAGNSGVGAAGNRGGGGGSGGGGGGQIIIVYETLTGALDADCLAYSGGVGGNAGNGTGVALGGVGGNGGNGGRLVLIDVTANTVVHDDKTTSAGTAGNPNTGITGGTGGGGYAATHSL